MAIQVGIQKVNDEEIEKLMETMLPYGMTLLVWENEDRACEIARRMADNQGFRYLEIDTNDVYRGSTVIRMDKLGEDAQENPILVNLKGLPNMVSERVAQSELMVNLMLNSDNRFGSGNLPQGVYVMATGTAVGYVANTSFDILRNHVTQLQLVD